MAGTTGVQTAGLAQSVGQAKPVDDTEMLMQNAVHEIRNLRRRNEILEAKVDMIDLFATVLFSNVPHQSVGASPDISYALERKIEELKSQAQNAKQP